MPTCRSFLCVGCVILAADIQVDPALPGPNVMGDCAGTDLWNTTHEAWGMNGTYDAFMYTAVGQQIIEAHDYSSAPLLLMLMFHNVHEPMEVCTRSSACAGVHHLLMLSSAVFSLPFPGPRVVLQATIF